MGNICVSRVHVTPPLPIKNTPCGNCAVCRGVPGFGHCSCWSSPVMDEANKKVLLILETEGQEAALKAMFTGERGQQLSYSEMRARYG